MTDKNASGSAVKEFCKLNLKLLIFQLQLFWSILTRLFRFFVPNSEKPLDNEIVLITGGASGIGREMALEFIQKGAKFMILWDIDEKANNATRQEIESLGGNAIAQTVDVCDYNKVQKAASAARNCVKNFFNDETAEVSILVNNAGMVTGKNILDCPPEKVQATFNLNIVAHFWTIKEFLPGMIANNHGRVVSICSIMGFGGIAGAADYSASKHAVMGLNESLYMELGKIKNNQVKTSIICPYLVGTDMFAGCSNAYPWLIDTIPVEEMARVIVSSVRRGKEMVIYPYSLWGSYLMNRFFGLRMAKKLADILKANSSMETFVGKQSVTG